MLFLCFSVKSYKCIYFVPRPQYVRRRYSEFKPCGTPANLRWKGIKSLHVISNFCGGLRHCSNYGKQSCSAFSSKSYNKVVFFQRMSPNPYNVIERIGGRNKLKNQILCIGVSDGRTRNYNEYRNKLIGVQFLSLNRRVIAS